MQRAASFTYRAERIFVLAASLLVGLGLTLLISRPGAEPRGTNSTALFWLMTLALMAVAGTGAAWLRRSEVRPANARPALQVAAGRIVLPFETLLPSLLTAGFALILQIFESGIVQALVLSFAALSFAAVFWAQTHTVDTGDRYFALGQSALNVLSHLAAFMLFSIIYGLKERALISATAVGVIATLLLVELLLRDAAWRQELGRPLTRPASRIILLSVAAGFVLAQLTWGLNYWAALTTLVAGAFLLAAFYVVYGLLSHYIEGSLDRQTFVEFVAVGVVAMVVIFGSAFFGNG